MADRYYILDVIQNERIKRGMTQRDAADMLGLSQSQYSQRETDKTEFKLFELTKFMAELKIPPERLLNPNHKKYYEILGVVINELRDAGIDMVHEPDGPEYGSSEMERPFEVDFTSDVGIKDDSFSQDDIPTDMFEEIKKRSEKPNWDMKREIFHLLTEGLKTVKENERREAYLERLEQRIAENQPHIDEYERRDHAELELFAKENGMKSFRDFVKYHYEIETEMEALEQQVHKGNGTEGK